MKSAWLKGFEVERLARTLCGSQTLVAPESLGGFEKAQVTGPQAQGWHFCYDAAGQGKYTPRTTGVSSETGKEEKGV